MIQQQTYVHHENQAEINRANVFNVMDSVVSETLKELSPKPISRIKSISSQLASYQAALSQMKQIVVIKQKPKVSKPKSLPVLAKPVNKMDLNYTRRIQSVRRMYNRGDINRPEFDRLCVIWRHLKNQNDQRILPFGRVNRRNQITWR